MESLNEQGDYATLSERFQLCNTINDKAGYHHLLMWMRNAFTIMAMVDYPYAASFLGPLPAWPVHAACDLLVSETNSGVDILTAFKDLAGILYNDTSNCFDIYAQFIEVIAMIFFFNFVFFKTYYFVFILVRWSD